MTSAVADEIIQDFANNASLYEGVNSADYGTPGDEKLHVKFTSQSHFNDAKSREMNRPVFEMADYIVIMVPGDKDSIVNRPVREGDKTRFATQWSRYSAGQSQVIGTPLSEWGKITRAQVDELAYFNIRTIEDLANVSDASKGRFMGMNELSEKAKAHLKLLKESEPLDKMQAELAKRDEQAAVQQEQINQLMAQLAALTAVKSDAPSDQKKVK